ncbi:helix-hairpin-helix domain-containing protein [Verrucosispora sp. ts21]|uniref:ComEA family DNA-binding protein n=1 Tax=Verrucosispora sp. ts21 TaxID=2069341 RepID=UPI0011AFA1C2|nr:helix-hairpin-helix domain-containing protein [Verrucosispora sp. ts21]
MSSAPEPGRWPPPTGHPPPGHPFAGHHPAGPAPVGHPAARFSPPGPPSPAAKFSWRLMHSWWLLLPILGFSCLGGFGFLYVGLRARRPAWWIAGIGYLLVGWTVFALIGEADPESALSDWMAGLVLAVWAASILHAFLINSSWLQWRAGHRPWYAEQPPGGPGSPYPPGPLAPPPSLSPTAPEYPSTPPTSPAYPSEAPTMPLHPPGQPTSAWYPPTQPTSAAYPSAPPTSPAYSAGDPTFAAYPPPLPPTDHFGAGPVPGQPVDAAGPQVAHTGPVEVNTAGLDDLAGLPGFDPQRARQVLAERDRRGGFGSLSEFVAAAGLAPHEYARLRDRLVCAPPAPPTPGQPPQGRVLDV